MSNSSQNTLLNTMDKIFANTQGFEKSVRAQLPKNKNLQKRELELALTVLLVDLASCDQNFEPREYQMISAGLRRMFGTTREQVQALVNQANLVLKNLRGTNRFAQLLKDSLSSEQRQVVMELINDVIATDGVEDGFEVYLRHKLSDMLGVPFSAKKQNDSK